MWSVDGSLVWTIEYGSGCQLASLRFADWDKTFVTVTKKRKIVAWSVEDGARSLDRGDDEDPNFHKSSFQMVLSADICPKAELLAIASRGRSAQIWIIEEDGMLSSCHTS
ncbi:NACHT and WD domain [Paramyrothecium foliicola]|nr:NACHT and WD domain [Paramyrothecium foliicola]